MHGLNNDLLFLPESKKQKSKRHRKYVIKQKLKFENYKNCLEAMHLENDVTQLDKNKLHVDSLRKYHNKCRKRQ